MRESMYSMKRSVAAATGIRRVQAGSPDGDDWAQQRRLMVVLAVMNDLGGLATAAGRAPVPGGDSSVQTKEQQCLLMPPQTKKRRRGAR
jgi:hypothetical protein